MKQPKAPDYAALAREQGVANDRAAVINTQLERPNEYTPWGSRTWTRDPNDPNQWSSTISLSPQQQQLQDSQDQTSLQLAQLLGSGADRVGAAIAQPFDGSRLPALSSGPGSGSVQGAIDTAGLAALPGTNDFSGDRVRVEDALLERFNRQSARDEESLRQRLANQGLTPGSEAWNREFETLNQGRNDARTQAILAGGQEQSRLFDMAARARGQGFGERVTEAGFGNQAEAQRFSQALSGAQFGNQARTQGIQEQAWMRQLPLNELNALRTGSQVQAPTFQAYGSGQTSAAPIFQAGQAQGQADLARSNNLLSGLFSLGGAGLGAAGAAGGFGSLFSDRRLKRDVERIGTHESGLPLYRYEYVWGEPAIGVMADEAELLAPAAVREHESGFKVVDYAEL